jgi:hypothetical protein
MTEDENGLKDLKTKEEKEIAKLKERKLELEVLISSLEVNLRRNGYFVDEQSSQLGSSTTPGASLPQAGIRINDQLSFRGKEKCVEFYSRLDEDNDQLVNFCDMRGQCMSELEFSRPLMSIS